MVPKPGGAPVDRRPPWHLRAPLVLVLGVTMVLAANGLDGSVREATLGLLGAAALLVGVWMVANGYARRWRSLVGFLLASIATTAILDGGELAGTAGLLVGVVVHAGARRLAESRGVPNVPRVLPDDRPSDPVGTRGH